MADDWKVRPPAESFLPLTETTIYILSALQDEPMHGYAIAKLVKERSGGTVEIAIGNLYTALKRLADQRLIEHHATQQEADQRRKIYRLTGLGAEVLELQNVRLRRLVMVSAGGKLRTQGSLT